MPQKKGMTLKTNDRCEGQFQWAFADIQSQFTSVEDQYISKASHILTGIRNILLKGINFN